MREYWDFEPRVALQESGNRKWRILLENASDARYVQTGHLVFMRKGTLMAVPFDLDNPDQIGQPVPIIRGVMQMLNSTNSINNTSAGQYDISDSGSLVYAIGGIIPDRENSLIWMDQTGGEEPITSQTKPYFAPRLSPYGRKIVYSILGEKRHIEVYDIIRGISQPFLSEDSNIFPIWTKDGKRIIFASKKLGASQIIYWKPVDGSEGKNNL